MSHALTAEATKVAILACSENSLSHHVLHGQQARHAQVKKTSAEAEAEAEAEGEAKAEAEAEQETCRGRGGGRGMVSAKKTRSPKNLEPLATPSIEPQEFPHADRDAAQPP